ncbi:MAG: sugar kinase [Bryobacteraceae bacterium]|nr:sugar kinase [Bryobacterales bacterium]MEB2360307.1 sugar kinase [Bryobacterales bacterium]NUM99550.1 sugar kinase [Bryobacteraceae bacterium]
MKILVAGELNPDLILQGYEIFPTPGKEILVDDLNLTMGSASAICAMGLARLGNRVSFLAKVGKDPWGEFCTGILKEGGIDTSRVIRDENLKTGLTVSVSAPGKDRALVTYLGAISELEGGDITDEVLSGFDHLHISSFFLQRKLRRDVRSVFALARRLGLSTSLDPGYDPSERWENDLVEILPEVHVFFPNEVELSAITGEQQPAEALRKLSNGRTLTVAKLGGNGCMAFDGGEIVEVPAIPVKPIDTTGAGDSFNAGFIHAWLRKFSLRDAMRFASVCGGLSTQGVGGTSAQATEGQVRTYLNSSTGSFR